VLPLSLAPLLAAAPLSCVPAFDGDATKVTAKTIRTATNNLVAFMLSSYRRGYRALPDIGPRHVSGALEAIIDRRLLVHGSPEQRYACIARLRLVNVRRGRHIPIR
jgi:hypothetical protein